MNASDADIKGRNFLITGGTSGVGKATALGLARLGAKIIIISRSAERAQAALAKIAKVTGNDRGEYLVGDLTLKASIRQLADDVKRKYDHLNVLANCSGAVYPERQFTAEGMERLFMVGYLSHFLLTVELLDLLKASAPSRVITVLGAPRFLKDPTINFDDLQFEQHFSGLSALAQTLFEKTAFTFELAKRLEGTGVTSNGFHPGSVKSNFGQNLPGLLDALGGVANLLAKTECEIAVYLAAARDVAPVNGAYFDDKKNIIPLKVDAAAGAKLWDISKTLTRRV